MFRNIMKFWKSNGLICLALLKMQCGKTFKEGTQGARLARCFPHSPTVDLRCPFDHVEQTCFGSSGLGAGLSLFFTGPNLIGMRPALDSVLGTGALMGNQA